MNGFYLVLIYFCIGIPVAFATIRVLGRSDEASDDTLGLDLVGLMAMWPLVVVLLVLCAAGWCLNHGLAYLYRAIFQRTP